MRYTYFYRVDNEWKMQSFEKYKQLVDFKYDTEQYYDVTTQITIDNENYTLIEYAQVRT